MIDPRQLRENVIGPVLRYIGAWSRPAEDLLLGTAAQESHLGTYLRQLGNGPAMGIYQMEPATARDIRDSWLRYKDRLATRVGLLRYTASLGTHDDPWSEQLAANLAFATAMCRIHYLRQPGAIPDTLEGQAAYWKRFYNTPLGRGTEDEYIDNWHRLVEP